MSLLTKVIIHCTTFSSISRDRANLHVLFQFDILRSTKQLKDRFSSVFRVELRKEIGDISALMPLQIIISNAVSVYVAMGLSSLYWLRKGIFRF